MDNKFDCCNSIIITIDHANCISPLAGFARHGRSMNNTKDVLIFIPTDLQDSLINLLRK